MGTAPTPRPHLAALPSYRPGRTAGSAMADHGLASAVKLASNELPLHPLPSVTKAIEAAVGTVNRYPDHLATELRRHLGELLGVPTDRVAVGCGSVGLLQQLALAFAGPDDEVVYGWPSFEAYPVFAGLTGAVPRPVPLRRLTLDVAAIVATFTPHTRLVLVANPNNPTGTALRSAELLTIADALPPGCLLVLDEAYREFVTGADVPDGLALLGDRPDVAVLRTFSKAHGLAALRVGYLVGDPSVVAAVDRVLAPFAVNALGQAAASASLAAPDELVHRVDGLVTQRDRVTASLRHRGWSVPDAQANFAWLPAGDAAAPLARELERHGVVTRPFPGDGVRVTIGTATENDRFLTAFGDVVDDDPTIGRCWQLPVGPAAARTTRWVERLDAVADRLHRHATSGRPTGRTDPDPGGDERWDAGQIWAHLVEQAPYWLGQLDHVLHHGRTDPIPFGRTKADPHRIAGIEAGRHRPVGEVWLDLSRSIDGLRARLLDLGDADWACLGSHETLGELDVEDQLAHFLVGHLEEHADQLGLLAAER